MKNNENLIKYKDEEYKIVFNLNVMDTIQKRYETLENWGNLTEGKNGEANVEAIIFGLTEMINEGIEIDNEDNGTDRKPLSLKKVGRILSEVGLDNVFGSMQNVIVESTETNSKNE